MRMLAKLLTRRQKNRKKSEQFSAAFAQMVERQAADGDAVLPKTEDLLALIRKQQQALDEKRKGDSTVSEEVK